MNKELRQLQEQLIESYTNYYLNKVDVAFKQTQNYFSLIANDIYDSCIQQFYSSYTPRVYTRHGNITGFNLYSPKNFVIDENNFEMNFDSRKLLKYKANSKKHVFDLIFVHGIRGLNKSGRNTPMKGRGMGWVASYPNKFSKFTSLSISKDKRKMNSIFDDFVEQLEDGLYKEKFWEYFNK